MNIGLNSFMNIWISNYPLVEDHDSKKLSILISIGNLALGKYKQKFSNFWQLSIIRIRVYSCWTLFPSIFLQGYQLTSFIGAYILAEHNECEAISIQTTTYLISEAILFLSPSIEMLLFKAQKFSIHLTEISIFLQERYNKILTISIFWCFFIQKTWKRS